MNASGKIAFQTVKISMKHQKISITQDYSTAILLWYDYLREYDYFTHMKPWQIVNRIPRINLLCRKAPFIILIRRMKTIFPTLYNFIPQSFIVPIEEEKFEKAFKQSHKKYIIKPDCGSLGAGIQILKPTDKFIFKHCLSIAQEYIPSCLINKTKFDLRIYVLVSSIKPLAIYVFRDGIARFCSQKIGSDTIFSQITNTALNHSIDSSVTHTISAVFGFLKSKGVNTDLIWQKIDNIAVLTIVSAYPFLIKGVEEQCKPNFYNRCFQILGFDILLDGNLNPYLLEVNYRPSLNVYSKKELYVKVKMLSAAMKIAFPYGNEVQNYINNDIKNFSEEQWIDYFNLKVPQNIKNKIKMCKFGVEKFGGFVRVFPGQSKENNKIYRKVLMYSSIMPTSLRHFSLPTLIKPLKHCPQIDEIVFDKQKSLKTNVKAQDHHEHFSSRKSSNVLRIRKELRSQIQ